MGKIGFLGKALKIVKWMYHLEKELPFCLMRKFNRFKSEVLDWCGISVKYPENDIYLKPSD